MGGKTGLTAELNRIAFTLLPTPGVSPWPPFHAGPKSRWPRGSPCKGQKNGGTPRGAQDLETALEDVATGETTTGGVVTVPQGRFQQCHERDGKHLTRTGIMLLVRLLATLLAHTLPVLHPNPARRPTDLACGSGGVAPGRSPPRCESITRTACVCLGRTCGDGPHDALPGRWQVASLDIVDSRRGLPGIGDRVLPLRPSCSLSD